MATETSSEDKRFIGRSPAYPFIPLDKALVRAGELRKAIGKADTRAMSAVHHWGYGPKSSGGIQTVAALKHFGLLVDEGNNEDRRVRLTEMALRILLDDRPNSQERQALIQKSALMPKVHQELWERWGRELPVDAELRHYLIWDRLFNENGARDLIAEYKATLEFAGLFGSDTMSPAEADKLSSATEREMNPMEQIVRDALALGPRFAGGEASPQQSTPVAEGTSSLVLYNDRIRITADVDLDGAKDLMRKLQKRIDLLEEELGPH